MTLDDAGKLMLSYMGTDPLLQAVDMKHSGDIDYEALDTEYQQLAAQIQAIGAPTEPEAVEDQLTLTAQVS